MDADKFRRLQMVAPDGSAIAEARKQCKLSQQDLAGRTRLDRRTIEHAEKSVAVTVDTIERIHAALREAGFPGPLEDLVLLETAPRRERQDKAAAVAAEPADASAAAVEPVPGEAPTKGASRRQLWIVAAGCLLGGLVLGGLVGYLIRSESALPPDGVRINRPADGVKAGFGIRVEGMVRGDSMVQLLVGNSTQSVFFPQPPVTRRDAKEHRWEACAYLGEPNPSANNTTWYLLAVVPRKEISRPLSADQLAEFAASQSNRIKITRTTFSFESGCGGS